MFKIELDEQQLEKYIHNAVQKAMKKYEERDQLPPLMTRRQFMEMAGISSAKCNELFNREDFPVTRELGHPRVVTKEFFEWISSGNDIYSMTS